MNYYRRYSGDYLRDTSRLNLTEHGAYSLLLDYYYTEEKPLPPNREEIYVMVRAIKPEDRAAVDKVLERYFELRNDGYHNGRTDEELAAALPHIEAARANGRKGGRPRKNPEETQRDTQRITQLETQRVTQQEPSGVPPEKPSSNHQPPTSIPQPTNPTVGLNPDNAGEAARRKEAKAVGKRAIAYLNTKAGTRFKDTEANLKLPIARVLYDEATEADLKAVVDLKVAESAKGEFDRKYLRPATLWNAEKFSQYSGQVSITDAPPASVMVKAFAERDDGSQELLIEYKSNGLGAEAAARNILSKHAKRLLAAKARNIVLDNGRGTVRFSLEELEASTP